MKFIIRNFLYLFKRFTTSTVINILGLSVAFAVFIVVAIQLRYDYTFNKSFEKVDNIYYFSNGYQYSTINIELPQRMKDEIPEIKNYGLLEDLGQNVIENRAQDGSIRSYKGNILGASVGLLDVFSVQVLAGDAKQVFLEPGKAMISESMAKKMFGDDNPLGKNIEFLARHIREKQSYNIVAVYKDFPENSSLKNGVYTLLFEHPVNTWNYLGYFEIETQDINKVVEKINSDEFLGEELAKYYKENPDSRLIRELTPLADVYFSWGNEGKNNLNTFYSLLAISILVLLIAYINLVNLSLAMVPGRVRSVNIYKIYGISPNLLRLSIALEGVFMAMISFVLALLYMLLIKGSVLDDFFVADLSLSVNASFIVMVGLVLLFLTFVFSIYPAIYVSSFDEAMTLKGSFSLSPKGAKVRNILVTFQFIAAISLMVISCFVKKQHDFMVNYSWGIEKENIIYFSKDSLNIDINTFGEELKRDPQVKGYTASLNLPGYVTTGWGRGFEGKVLKSFKAWIVAPSFLDFFGVQLVAGDGFSEKNLERDQVVFNEELVRTYELDESIIGKPFSGYNPGNIVGIAKNVNFESLHEPINPMAFVVLKNADQLRYIFVKISAVDMPQTIKRIENTWNKSSKGNFTFNFLDEKVDGLYKKENNQAKLIGFLGLITIIIAIMGIYGLIAFNTYFKMKEIGIRKINGATEKEILLMLNKDLLILLLIAFVIAVPVSYYLVTVWIKSYAYKTSIDWWIFALAGLCVFLISVITVSWQSWKAATANPIDAVKNE